MPSIMKIFPFFLTKPKKKKQNKLAKDQSDPLSFGSNISFSSNSSGDIPKTILLPPPRLRPLLFMTFHPAHHHYSQTKRLAAIASRWQQFAAIGRRRIPMSKPNVRPCKKSAPNKGHFTVYTRDGRRFAIPLAYHNSPIFRELFKLSEDEYGLPSDGPITIPSDVTFM